MQTNKSSYRDSMLKWFEDSEKNWKSCRKGFVDHHEESELQQWENEFYKIKRAVESKYETIDDNELYDKVKSLYDQFERFSDKKTNRKDLEITQSVPIGGHQLPPLPYAYNALEPVISEETMRLHHDILHQNYVNGLNKAELELQKARETGNFDLVKHWERELAFNGAGHYLHTIFWTIMSPTGGGEPTGDLRKEIDKSFGSFNKFKMQFTKAAEKVEGPGWAILVWSPRAHRLEILTAEKHQNLTQWDVIPLLVLDVWEHAYYLQYKTDRAKYIENWWKLVNWNEVEQRYNKARTVMWKPY